MSLVFIIARALSSTKPSCLTAASEAMVVKLELFNSLGIAVEV